MDATHFSLDELAYRIDEAMPSPTQTGTVDLLVVRPDEAVRETPTAVTLSRSGGVSGDRWSRGRYAERIDMQVSLISTRVIQAIAGDQERWQLAGNNLVVDLDLGVHNLPPGSVIEVGGAKISISEQPHRGCAKFSSRFGAAAREFVNLGDGPERRLRGAYASVVKEGVVEIGDPVARL